MSSSDDFHHYLPVSAVQVDWGAYLAGAGRNTVEPGNPYPPQEHPALYACNWRTGRILPDYQILLIQDGRGTFESEETGVIDFDSTTVLFLFPDVWHRYRPDPDVGWTERWISFNGELVHRFYDQQEVSPTRPLVCVSEESRAKLASRYDDLLQRIHARSTENSFLYSFHIMGLIAEAVECTDLAKSDAQVNSPKPDQPDADPIVNRALEIIWTQSNRPLSIDEIAKRLPVTRRTLDRRFTEATGRTVLEEINRCRLARAKRLLRETHLPIKALAHLAGFASQERLRVSLLASEGLSPSAFREKYGYQSREQS